MSGQEPGIFSSPLPRTGPTGSSPESAIIEDAERGITYGLRGYDPETDGGVVFGPWMNQSKTYPPLNRFSSAELSLHRALLGEIVDRCPPVLACHPEHPEQVYGWVIGEIGEVPVLHFVYVRGDYGYRRHGIGTRLMSVTFPGIFRKQAIHYTHPGSATKHLEVRWMLKFNPYLVRP